MLHHLLLPLTRASVLLGDEDGFYEVLLLRNDGVYLLFTAEIVLNGLLGDRQPGFDQVLVESFIVEVHQYRLLLVGDEGHEFFQPFREGALLALVVVGEVRVEVERLLLLSHEELQDLNQDLPDLWV